VRWDGMQWLALGSGTNNAAVTLHEHNGALVIGGWFDMAGSMPNGYMAEWGTTCAPGDINGDAFVNVDDLLMVINSWGECATSDCPADANHNGFVDVDDLLEVINHWSQP